MIIKHYWSLCRVHSDLGSQTTVEQNTRESQGRRHLPAHEAVPFLLSQEDSEMA